MEPPADFFVLNALEQVRAVADPLRLRLLVLLFGRSYTAMQLAALIDEAPAKVHYHVRELERVGLIRIVETREKGNIVEKYYQAIARSMTISPAFLRSMPPDELATTVETLLASITQEALTAVADLGDDAGRQRLRLTHETVWLTSEEESHFLEALEALIAQYRQRGQPSEREFVLNVLLYFAQGLQSAMPSPTLPPPSPAVPKPKIGVLMYSRSDLEALVSRGERMSLHLIGVCSFSRDVTADLIERAIEQFSIKGTLLASSDVREALRHKA